MKLKVGLITAVALALLLAQHELLAQPTLAISLVPKVSISAEPGTVSAIQYTTNLGDTNSWVTLTTVRVTLSPFDYIDAAGSTFPERYYRAMTISTNPGPIDMVWISPGTFTMGSPTNEVGRSANEGPQTAVTLTRGFWMARFETTQQEYTNVIPGTADQPTQPVFVLWASAVNYCSALATQERAAGRLPDGYSYRLPTEAEWEYACRAGTTNRYSFGDDPLGLLMDDYAWWWSNSANQPQPVGLKLPNPWGLYDMYGNAAEWCVDAYTNALPGGAVTNPVVQFDSGLRTVKGGSVNSYSASNLRSAVREGTASGSLYRGIRVVLGPAVQ
jgi:formylglycine-generating enzyme required for sulfatase activity